MTTVRVLVVDDSASDAKLVVAELLRQGFELEWERVETMATFRSALLGSTWDVVLCDWTMPTLTAKDAHATLRETGLDIPFIIVTGTIGEEKAADAMRSGVHDVVLKDRLARLAPAIEREIRDRKLRHRHRISEARFTLLAESGIIGIAFGDLHGVVNCAGIAVSKRVVGRDGPHPLGDFERAIKVNLIGFEDLLINKRASGRAKDIADLENLPAPKTRRRASRG